VKHSHNDVLTNELKQTNGQAMNTDGHRDGQTDRQSDKQTETQKEAE